MIKRSVYYFLFFVFTTSCSNNKAYNQNTIDTSKIISGILTSGKIIEDLHDQIDTIYIIKPKGFYNASWPNNVNKLTIKYLEDNAAAKILNKPWEKVFDKRWRFVVPKFSVTNDTASVVFYILNSLKTYKYRLLKKHTKWTITNFAWSIE